MALAGRDMRNAASLAAGLATIAVLAAGVFVSVGCGGSEPRKDASATAAPTATPPATEDPEPTPVATSAGANATSTPEPTPAATPVATAAPCRYRRPDEPPPTPAATAAPTTAAATAAPTTAAATAAPTTAAATAAPTTAAATAAPTPSPAAERTPKPSAAEGAERGPDSPEVSERPAQEPKPTPSGVSTTTGGSQGAAASARGQEYTWHDGDHVQSVYLETTLVIQPSTENTDDDIVARDDGEASIVQAQPRHDEADTDPVFRSQAGDLMTLPGGVLLALDPEWDQARVDRFFSDNRIDRSLVQERDFATNAFFVETDPGFPSLNLANELAEQEGVLISSPNWRTEVSLR